MSQLSLIKVLKVAISSLNNKLTHGAGNETKKRDYVQYLSKAVPSLVGNLLVGGLMATLCLMNGMDKVTLSSDLVKSH